MGWAGVGVGVQRQSVTRQVLDSSFPASVARMARPVSTLLKHTRGCLHVTYGGGRFVLGKKKPLRASATPHGGFLGIPGNFNKAKIIKMKAFRFVGKRNLKILVPHESPYS